VAVLRRHGSPALNADAERVRERLAQAAGLTYSEILERLADSPQETAPTASS
jgi:hypothetical protein